MQADHPDALCGTMRPRRRLRRLPRLQWRRKRNALMSFQRRPAAKRLQVVSDVFLVSSWRP